MALFFDLSIPFIDSGSSSESKARKDARLKAVVRAMELGYAGVAYDRPFRGVLSDAERCQISPFPLSSLLKVAPALAVSASFHRDLLNAPQSVPFRQYTRLTVSAAGSPAVLALNGCHLLRTYDLVAVRPLSQDAFDKACQASEVNIIALDLSQKLPFRLKFPLVQLAIQRGLYFEITYSHLIGDVHVRRQNLSDVKLLADWTHGKNLIISSAATSVTEVRGPHDVINLAAYLLGLSVEQARASISRNCRELVANALKKKHFHKEAIRVERITPSEQLDSKRFWFGNRNAYDPLSSGEGDLPSLDDISRSFSSANIPFVHVNLVHFAPHTNQAPSMLGHNTVITPSPKMVCPSAAPGDTPSVSDDASRFGGPVLTKGMSMLLTGAKHCLDPLVMQPLLQHKSSCEDFPSSGFVSLITEPRESGGAVEVDGQLKTSDQCVFASDGFTKPSCNETLRACNSKDMHECDSLSLKYNPSSSIAIENKHVSDIVMEGHECSHLSNEFQVKMTTEITETMECTPITAHDQLLPKDDLSTFACSMGKNILREQIELKVLKQEQKDELMFDTEILYKKTLLHPELNNKGHNVLSSEQDIIEDGFVETKFQEGSTLLFASDALLKEEIVLLREDMIQPPLTTKAIHSKTKSGNRSHKEKLLRPAYPLLFKSLFKLMLYKKKLQKSKGHSNICVRR